MKQSKYLSTSMNDPNANQFLDNSGSMGDKNFSSDIRVKKLSQRNNKLQQQVIRIERALSNMDEKVRYGVKMPEVKKNVIDKELANGYKMIKQYEVEIKKKKKYEFQGAFVEELRKNEKVLKEKCEMSEKLRRSLHLIKKGSMQISKVLKNDNLRREYQQKNSSINGDIKWLHEKIRQAQIKHSYLKSNIQTQRNQIQKVEREMIKKQYSKDFIHTMRNKFLNYNQKQKQSESESQSQEFSNFRQSHGDMIIIEERTKDYYDGLINEVKLFRKLQKDYQHKIQVVSKEKQIAEEKNLQSRNKLLQTQYQIEKIQDQIIEIKRSIDPRNLKPNKKFDELYSSKTEKVIKKIKPSMPHAFKYIEIGTVSKGGKRFIDRGVIGRKSAKIIGIKFFENKIGENFLLGIQATYKIGTVIKKGGENLNVDRKLVEVQYKNFTLKEGDYIKSVDCMLDSKGQIVGIAFLSEKGESLRGGEMTSNRKALEFEFSENPVCIFGCLHEKGGLEMFGVEVLEE